MKWHGMTAEMSTLYHNHWHHITGSLTDLPSIIRSMLP